MKYYAAEIRLLHDGPLEDERVREIVRNGLQTINRNLEALDRME